MDYLREATIHSPFPLTTPSRQCENTVLIAKIIYRIVLAPDIFKANKVHIHILDIYHLSLKRLRRISKENIISPACSLKKDILTIKHKLSVTIFIEPTLDLSDTKRNIL